ncbi:hypothetical protein LXL04_032147 [Taraxacum kok-saghyz]
MLIWRRRFICPNHKGFLIQRKTDEFEMKDLGEQRSNWYGIKKDKKVGLTYVSCNNYIEKALHSFNLDQSKQLELLCHLISN